MPRANHRKPIRAWFVHLLRIGVVLGLLAAIPSPNADPFQSSLDPPSIETLTVHFPDPVVLDPHSDDSGLWTVRDEAGERLAKIGKTLPLASDVLGYRGPSQSLIVFDKELNISKVTLLSSRDTQEHVDAILDDSKFFDQFIGWPWGGPSNPSVDAVSGATLTSLAVAEGILKRIGGERPSLLFADPISTEEKSDWLESSESIDHLVRTGSLSDDIVGYQGPTELLFKLDGDKVERIEIRYSFDNDTYVDYVRTEYGFWALFQGKTIEQLASFDPKKERVEGVSGATMTSLAVADTIVGAAIAMQSNANEAAQSQRQSWWSGMRWGIADSATVSVLLALVVISHLKLFRLRWLRRTWLAFAFVVVGLWGGNLVSLALIAGWSAEGVAWRLAPGLALITVTAALLPAVTKGNPYCNHLCPHGAVQQLLRPGSKSRRRLRISPKWSRVLSWVPGITLSIAYIGLVTNASLDLSSWEPFHAYLFRIAGWGAIVLALASLLLALYIPMGYCRLGCPTGRLLDYLRRSNTSYRVQLADYIAIGLLIIAVWMHIQ